LLSQKDLNEIKYTFKSNNLNALRKSKGHVATLEDPTRPSIAQSRTFKLLQETLDNGLKENETVFYDNISNTKQTRRCSLSVNHMNKNLEKNEADTTSSLSSSSDVKSDNDEVNGYKKKEELTKNVYIPRSSSLAHARNNTILPQNVNTNNHQRLNRVASVEKVQNRFDESDMDEYSSSTENSNEIKLHNKL